MNLSNSDSVESIDKLIDLEIELISDQRIMDQIEDLRIVPRLDQKDWISGPSKTVECWTVLEDELSQSAIVHYAAGAPDRPWVLTPMNGTMGVQPDGFTHFIDAYFESLCSIRLPIWQIHISKNNSSERRPISEDMDWDTVWEKILELRDNDRQHRYDCNSKQHRRIVKVLRERST